MAFNSLLEWMHRWIMDGEPNVLKWCLLLFIVPFLYIVELCVYGEYVWWNSVLPHLTHMFATILRLSGLFQVWLIGDDVIFGAFENFRIHRHWRHIWHVFYYF